MNTWLSGRIAASDRTYLTGVTTTAWHNQFYAGCVIGEAPQDLRHKGEPTRLRIGDRTFFANIAP
jgi:acyl-[acyl carrier protein]--UDP-N-acetylglucosamine O-acyltransferase